MLPVELTLTQDGNQHTLTASVDWNGEGKHLGINYWYGKKTKKTVIKQLAGVNDYYEGGTQLPSELTITWDPAEDEVTYYAVAFDQENDYGISEQIIVKK